MHVKVLPPSIHNLVPKLLPLFEALVIKSPHGLAMKSLLIVSVFLTMYRRPGGLDSRNLLFTVLEDGSPDESVSWVGSF